MTVNRLFPLAFSSGIGLLLTLVSVTCKVPGHGIVEQHAFARFIFADAMLKAREQS